MERQTETQHRLVELVTLMQQRLATLRNAHAARERSACLHVAQRLTEEFGVSHLTSVQIDHMSSTEHLFASFRSVYTPSTGQFDASS